VARSRGAKPRSPFLTPASRSQAHSLLKLHAVNRLRLCTSEHQDWQYGSRRSRKRRLQKVVLACRIGQDGTNHAPALARSDVGNVMGTGSDPAMNSA